MRSIDGRLTQLEARRAAAIASTPHVDLDDPKTLDLLNRAMAVDDETGRELRALFDLARKRRDNALKRKGRQTRGARSTEAGTGMGAQ